MSMNNLSKDGEFRYIIQWFNEWSELQRDDFVYVLVEYLTKDTVGGAADGGGVYVNGVVNALATTGMQNKPMSLFQCRIKLFREWSAKWPLEFKANLQEKIIEMDAKVGEKIINELKGSHGQHNGDVSVHLHVNGSIEDIDIEQVRAEACPSLVPAADAASGAVIDETSEADNDTHLAAVLRQETPVDDDDDAAAAGQYASSTAVTTIAVNTPLQLPAGEPVQQAENNITAGVIASVAAVTSTTQAEVAPVA